MESGIFINWVLGQLYQKVIVPSNYHDQVKVVKEMLKDDVSGLVDSLTDFAVDSANVDFTIESDNEELTKVLKKWTHDFINKDYKGKIPSGLKALAKEYFRERWKYSSFPILKIAKWDTIGNIMLPSKMFFVDGEDVHAYDKDKDNNELQIINYDYYLGKEKKPSNKLDKNVIFNKPFCRWFEKYPVPFLIKRGVYHNWKLIQSIKKKEGEILNQVIPYLLLVKKGTEGMFVNKDYGYSNEELQSVVNEMKELMEGMKDSSPNNTTQQTPVRATNFDEKIEHLIPDLSQIFDSKLFAQAEKNILAGLGFIDVVDAMSTSRKESVMNPKGFMEEIKTGVEDFQQVMKEILSLIKEKNASHTKYINTEFYISSSPVNTFLTDDFKEKIRQLYDRGCVSKQTAVELIAEVDFRTEVFRRKKETKDGLDLELYPPVRENMEAKGVDFPTDNPDTVDTDGKEPSDDKKDPIEKKNYVDSKHVLEGAPYKTVNELPKAVKGNLDIDLQRVFLKVFNNTYQEYENDTRAFRVAWNVINKMGRKGKEGVWIRKRTRIDGKLQPKNLTRAMIEEALDKEETETIAEAVESRKLSIDKKREKLLDILLKNKDGK